MKAFNYFIAFSLLVAVSACGGKPSGEKVEASAAKEVAEATGESLIVDLKSSMVHWKGFKPGGSHYGVLSLKSGELHIEGNKLKSGTFVLDMNSINAQDLKDEKEKTQLENHLKSADFFDVENYPEGTFTITGVEELTGEFTHRISGNLKLKDTVKNITFNVNISKEDDLYKATSATFMIDRVQWGVNYGSKNIFKDLKDSFIDDEMEVTIMLVAKGA